MSDNKELLDTIRAQAEAAEGDDSFASLATWIGDRLTEQAGTTAETEKPGIIGDRTTRPGVGPANTIEDLARRIAYLHGED